VGLSEHFLVRRLRRGDREACRELIDRHHAGVYGYLRRLGADAALAEELTQETYVRAWRRIDSLRGSGSLRSWLLTIARNEFLQWARAGRPEATTPLDRLPETADDRPGAESDLARDERDCAVRRAVERLEPQLRETVALHYFQELSFRDVGRVLGIPAGTVKSRLNRALGRLRALLATMEADGDARTRAEEALAGDS
jgi:RNA polymerase sigma-70 factor (ECF subfamily)